MMILQNHYQRRRMYTRIALGKNRAMDVVSGESSGGTGQLVVLYPLLFGLQGFQCLIGNLQMVDTARLRLLALLPGLTLESNNSRELDVHSKRM